MARPAATGRTRRSSAQLASGRGAADPREPAFPVPAIAATDLAAVIFDDGNAALAWTDTNGGDSRYQVERSDDGGVFFIVDATEPGAATFADSTIPLGVIAVVYRVIGLDPLPGPPSNLAAGTLLTPPEIPTDLQATDIADVSAVITWVDNSDFESSFRVQLATDAGFTANVVETTYGQNVTTATLTGLTGAPATFYARVRAENTAGQSDWSAAISFTTVTPVPTAPPAAPTGPSVTAISSTSLRVNWTDGSNNEAGFTVQLATNNTFTTGLKTTSTQPNVQQATFTALGVATLYYARVRSYNSFAGGSVSAWTATVSGTTLAAASNGAGPLQPSELEATSVSATRVDLTWTAGGDGTETEYVIERSDDGGESWHECGRAATASYSDRSAPSGQTPAGFGLRYRIVGCSAGGVSLPSPSVEATTVALAATVAPDAPYGLVAYGHSGTEVFLFWRMGVSFTEEQFDIQVSPAGAGTWTSVNVGGGGNSFAPAGYTFARLTGLTASTSYDFRVRATNAAGSSSYTATATIATLGAGQVWCPTGRNPQVLINPHWYAKWLVAKSQYESNPTGTYAAKWYGKLRANALTAGTGSQETYVNAQIQAALYWNLTNAAGVIDAIYLSCVTKWFTIWAGEGTIVNAGAATTTMIQCTGLGRTAATQAADYYKDFKFYFNAGALLDPSVQAYRVLTSSYSAGVTTLTTTRALTQLPADGDTFYAFNPASTDGNNTREQFTEWAYLTDLAWGGLDADQRANMLCYGNNVLADTTVGTDNKPYVGLFPLNDSDQLTGCYFGMIVWAYVTAALGNPRAAYFQTAVDTNGLALGGRTATAMSESTVRNQIASYCYRAAGGEWIEGRAYNEGTTSLLMEGVRINYELTGIDYYPEGTRCVQGSVRNLLSSITPDLDYQHVYGDRDAAPGHIHFPNSQVRIAQQGGFLHGYDDVGPLAIKLNQLWWDTGGTQAVRPYGRFFAHMDPTLAPADFDTLPTVYEGGPTRRTVIHADRTTADGSSFVAYGLAMPFVHHGTEWVDDYLLVRNGERAIRHPEAYGTFSILPQGVNGVLWAGLPCCKQGSSGPVAVDTLADSHVYLRTGTQGDFYALPYANPPGTALYERTRQILYVPSASKNSDVVIDHLRGRASDPTKLNRFGSYRADRNYTATVVASPAPTGTTVSATITNLALNGYAGYWLLFTSGALNGRYFRVSASTSSGASGAGTTAFTVEAMSPAPAPGDKFTARKGSQFEAILLANGPFEWVHHCEVSPTLNSTDTAWQTTGGQYVRADHLWPVAFNRRLYNETTEFASTGATASELKYQFRTWGSAWPGDTTPVFQRLFNVVSVADMSNTVASSLVQSTVGPAVDAALVTRTGQPDVLAGFGAESTSPVLRTGFVLTFNATASSTQVFLASLDPRKTWSYTDSGGASTPITVPESGLGRLTLSGSGSHTLVVAGS